MGRYIVRMSMRGQFFRPRGRWVSVCYSHGVLAGAGRRWLDRQS